MKLTREWMETWFDEFNRIYFKGELPKPYLYVSHARKRLGCLGYKYDRKHPKKGPSDFRLGLSNYYVLAEWDYQNILLHEMIHLVVASKQLKDTSAHGQLFRSIQQQLNQNCGWDIKISIKTDGLSISPQYQQDRRFLVLAIVTADDRHFLSVVNPNYLDGINRQLARARHISSYAFYSTTDPYFIQFPQVRTPRGRLVDAETFQKK